jgi:hypothetical protein
MVASRKLWCFCLFVAVLFVSLGFGYVPFAHAQVTYSVSREWVKVWINSDGTVDFLYNISYTYLSGSPQGIFTVGMPKSGFQVHYCEDISGSSLTYQDISSGNYYGIDVYMKQPVSLTREITFVVYASVTGLVNPDSQNPGNYGLQFFPSTFASASGAEDLRLEIVLPPGVNSSEVKYPTGLPFDNVFEDENRTAIYWERTAWAAGDTFTGGVSFPQQYITSTPMPTTTPTPTFIFTPTPTSNQGFPGVDLGILGVVGFLIVVFVVVAVIAGVAKSAYQSPLLSVEALGANRSLTAVEAGLVMGLEPVRVLTMMLYGLLLKRMIVVTETEPLLKLKKLEAPAGGAAAASPRYYEIDVLSAIKPDGTLDEGALARTYQGLVNTVNRKLRGYSRVDTENYYKSIVDKAWLQVTQAGTPELKGDALNQNLDWLLADGKFNDRFKTAFPPNIIIVPNPAWWWYWGGPRFPTGQPSGQVLSKPAAGAPASSPLAPAPIPAKPTPLPGQDFANSVVRGMQSASNNMVKNIQDFANKLVPFAQAPQQSREGSVAGRPSCVCACHACACACACVGCACACAGGGAR